MIKTKYHGVVGTGGRSGNYWSGKTIPKHEIPLYLQQLCLRDEVLDLFFFVFFILKKQKWVLLIMRSKRNIQWLILNQYFSLPNLDGAFVCLKIMLAMLITCCCCCCLNEMEPFYHPGSSATTLQHLLSRLPVPSTMSAQWHPQQTGQH